MDCFEKFLNLREKYPKFIYEKYEINDDGDNLNIRYFFNIPDLTWFYPEIRIPKKYIINKQVNQDYLEYFVFNIGLIELISYFKCTCSPTIEIKAGYLDDEQIRWFKKLYYNGLGEFLYTNKISVEEENFVNIICTHKECTLPVISYTGNGNLIAVGGGKDSCVSLEILKEESKNSCFLINPKIPSLECCEVAGYQENDVVCIQRILDRKIVSLNEEGYLNGHTPFSSLIAFLSYLCCYLQNKKNVVLSNESSANEATVLGTNINHQYSKTYEFEQDFNSYTHKYFHIDIYYFSLLRGLSEFQIGKLFSHYKKYHSVFKSCNLGSKLAEWKWCCDCPKCLFVYIILSPFLYKKELVDIFGQDLYERENLLNTFIEILGYTKVKPFECVGTYQEARYAVSLLINKLAGNNLPYLLQYYVDHYPLELDKSNIEKYNDLNNLNEYYTNLVKKELIKYV